MFPWLATFACSDRAVVFLASSIIMVVQKDVTLIDLIQHQITLLLSCQATSKVRAVLPIPLDCYRLLFLFELPE